MFPILYSKLLGVQPNNKNVAENRIPNSCLIFVATLVYANLMNKQEKLLVKKKIKQRYYLRTIQSIRCSHKMIILQYILMFAITLIS